MNRKFLLLWTLNLILEVGGLNLRNFHSSWDTAPRKDVDITDIYWNYCDLKCVYL